MNMNLLSNRISFIQEKTGWKNAEIARRAGVERATVTEWKIGKTKTMSATVAQKLSAESGFASDWLSTGSGSVYAEKSVNYQYTTAIAEYIPALLESAANASEDAIQYVIAVLKNEVPHPLPPNVIGKEEWILNTKLEEWNRLPKLVQDAAETFIETAKLPYPVSKIVCLPMVRKLRSAVSLMLQGSDESWDEAGDSAQDSVPLLAHDLELDKVIDNLRRDIFHEIFPISYDQYRQLGRISKEWITGAMKKAIEMEAQLLLENG